METKNITPEEKRVEIQNVIKAKNKVLSIARHNLLTQIGRIVRKYHNNSFVIDDFQKIAFGKKKYEYPLLVKTVDFVPPKQKDQVFHETKIYLNAPTAKELDPDTIPVEDIVGILDLLLFINAN